MSASGFGMRSISRLLDVAVDIGDAIGQGAVAVAPQVLDLIQPVIGETRPDICSICVCEDAADCFLVRLSGRPIQGGGCTVGDNGERRFGGHRWHLR